MEIKHTSYGVITEFREIKRGHLCKRTLTVNGICLVLSATVTKPKLPLYSFGET